MRALHKLIVGFLLRCPNCERGRMFRGLFTMEPTCPNCGVRFERSSGEALGGMMVNLVLAEILALGGFFISEAIFHPPFITQIVFWTSFNVLFCLLFYRHARAMWVSVSYLTDGLHVDSERQ